jgi:hypothetical protein
MPYWSVSNVQSVRQLLEYSGVSSLDLNSVAVLPRFAPKVIRMPISGDTLCQSSIHSVPADQSWRSRID